MDFDLDKYLRASKKVDLEGVAWDRVKEHPVSLDEARCLAYMMDIESHTVIYLRDLLFTRAAHEPDVTAFLSCWVYEELWHGEAFSRFLGEAGYRLPPDWERPGGRSPYPTRYARNSWIRRSLGAGGLVGHAATLLGSAFIKDFVALHMTWGAVNELSTLTGYHVLIDKTEHPVLVDLLNRIIKDERRHFAFYRAQAKMRLARSRHARRITRWAMDHLWAPVGTGVRPQIETDFVISYLLEGESGRATSEEMDEMIRELPGFEDAHLIRDARTEALVRLRSTGPASEFAYSISPSPRAQDVA
ncbi:MAG: ferritin-like domain-containing protein [Actinomycetota bacterium]